MYGFSGNMPCFAGEKIPSMHNAGKGPYPFTGVYSGTLANERVKMPDMFSRSLAQGRFVLVVPEKNSSALLISENGSEWEMIKQLLDAADNDNPAILRERFEIDDEGNLYFPERVSKFAGIHTPFVAVIGHGYAIEITDSGRYHSRIV